MIVPHSVEKFLKIHYSSHLCLIKCPRQEADITASGTPCSPPGPPQKKCPSFLQPDKAAVLQDTNRTFLSNGYHCYLLLSPSLWTCSFVLSLGGGHRKPPCQRIQKGHVCLISAPLHKAVCWSQPGQVREKYYSG